MKSGRCRWVLDEAGDSWRRVCLKTGVGRSRYVAWCICLSLMLWRRWPGDRKGIFYRIVSYFTELLWKTRSHSSVEDCLQHDLNENAKKMVWLTSPTPPFPQIDIIEAVVIVWRARGKIIRSVLCSIVCNNCTQWTAHTWTDLTVLWIGFCLTGPISLCLDSFLCMYYFMSWLYIACMCTV